MQVTPKPAIAPPTPSAETLKLDVSGMKCAGCVRAVETQLTQQPGVSSAVVNLVTAAALVEYDPSLTTAKNLAQTLNAAGFPSTVRWASDPTVQPAETAIAPDVAEQQQEETRKQFQRVAIAAMLLILSTIGHLKHFGWEIPVLSGIWFHALLATLALLFPGRPILVDGWHGLRHNIPNMNTLVSMGTLSAYGASVIVLIFPQLGWECFFDEPVMLLGFILLGRALEQQARGRATAAFQSLLALQPTLARLMKQRNSPNLAAKDPATKDPASGLASETAESPSVAKPYIEIPADRVKVGEWLQVLPGDRIPVDGRVVVGQTTVNESMLTGESLPVLKQPGDSIAAGSLNQSGSVVIEATRTGADTTLAQMLALLETAQTRKAPVQKVADTIAGYFTYGVMAIALLTFLFWYFIGAPLWADTLFNSGMGMAHSMEHSPSMAGIAPVTAWTSGSPLLLSLKLAIAVLVVACPCALGLATPTAILVGSSLGAERGILIRGGDVLEKVHQLNTIVFDKTGTLTTGHPQVTDCISLQDGLSEATLLQLAATVESGTQHPLAEAILQAAQAQALPLLAAEQFQTEPGFGVAAAVEGQPILLGNPSWLQHQQIPVSDAAQAQIHALAVQGKTPVCVAMNGHLAGVIAVLDTLRPDAQTTVAQLRQQGLRVLLLTGDQPVVAEAIAQSLNLPAEDVMANISPKDKLKAIANLQNQGNRVAMVGDGINDASALAQADVGISLYSGTDVATETAEIILMHDRLTDVLESIRLSRATFNKIRQNLFWAFAYNIVGIPAAAGFLLPIWGMMLSPAIAAALMALSSVSVVTNSLLLRRTLPSQ